MAIRAVVFDYDGTLIDALPAYYEVIIAHQKSRDLTIIDSYEELREAMDGGFSGFMALMKKHGIGVFQIPKVLRFIKEELSKVPAEKTKLYPGIKPLLKSIDHPLYVVTSNIGEVVRKHLVHHNIAVFADVIGADRHTSKVRKIREVAQQQGCRTDELVCIGDTSSDIVATKKAGAVAIAVTYGYGNSERIKAAQPDYTVHSVKELQALLRKLGV